MRVIEVVGVGGDPRGTLMKMRVKGQYPIDGGNSGIIDDGAIRKSMRDVISGVEESVWRRVVLAKEHLVKQGGGVIAHVPPKPYERQQCREPPTL